MESRAGGESGLRIAVTGASGNIGSALLDVLEARADVSEVRALARRPPTVEQRSKVHWQRTDVLTDDLGGRFAGADVVVHLAWMIQPSWNRNLMRTTNVDGSARVFEAAATAGVGAIVHASSLGAYGPGSKDRLVDESWPLGGHLGHPYSLQKAQVEAELDRFERRHPTIRVVRMRPALVFQAAAGRELRNYFLPRPTPGFVLSPRLVLRNPARFQAVHAHDVAAAFAAAACGSASGAFNVATTDIIGGRARPGLAPFLRPVVWAAWRLHLQPVDPGWVTLVFHSPLIDPARAEAELGWKPTHLGHEALEEALVAMARPPEPTTDALAG